MKRSNKQVKGVRGKALVGGVNGSDERKDSGNMCQCVHCVFASSK